MAQAPTPSIPVLALGADTGRSDTGADGITNIGTPTLSGTAAPGALMTVCDSDGFASFVPTGISDSKRFWSIAAVGVFDDGSHEITAVAATAPGETTSAHRSAPSLITDTGPAAPILHPACGTGLSQLTGLGRPDTHARWSPQ